MQTLIWDVLMIVLLMVGGALYLRTQRQLRRRQTPGLWRWFGVSAAANQRPSALSSAAGIGLVPSVPGKSLPGRRLTGERPQVEPVQFTTESTTTTPFTQREPSSVAEQHAGDADDRAGLKGAAANSIPGSSEEAQLEAVLSQIYDDFAAELAALRKEFAEQLTHLRLELQKDLEDRLCQQQRKDTVEGGGKDDAGPGQEGEEKLSFAILDLLYQGLTDADIAARLQVAEAQVERVRQLLLAPTDASL
jgi:hypothetical protein